MPTVPIEVVTYKKMFETLAGVYETLNSESGIDSFFNDYDDLPMPDWVCDCCGHIDSEGPDNCTRCDAFLGPVVK